MRKGKTIKKLFFLHRHSIFQQENYIRMDLNWISGSNILSDSELNQISPTRDISTRLVKLGIIRSFMRALAKIVILNSD